VGGLGDLVSVDMSVKRSVMLASHTNEAIHAIFLFGPRVDPPILSEHMAENADRDHILGPQTMEGE